MKELGRFFYQLSGYTYAGVFLAAVMKMDAEPIEFIKLGAIVGFCFAALGYFTIKRSKNKE